MEISMFGYDFKLITKLKGSVGLVIIENFKQYSPCR